MPKPLAAADRRVQRRSLFVAAALQWQGAAAPAPVRIRNLSVDGALIEGVALPEIGASVRLCRAQHSAAGELLWRGPFHAGLRFVAPVTVADWLPGRGHDAGQQRIDEVMLDAKAAPPGDPAATPLAQTPPDYAALARSLVRAGEELIADPHVAQRHPFAVQAIAIAAQALGRLASDQ